MEDSNDEDVYDYKEPAISSLNQDLDGQRTCFPLHQVSDICLC